MGGILGVCRWYMADLLDGRLTLQLILRVARWNWVMDGGL